MVSTELPIATVSIELQLPNAYVPMFVTESGIIKVPVSPLQPSKALSGIFFTLSPIFKVANAVQPSNILIL